MAQAQRQVEERFNTSHVVIYQPHEHQTPQVRNVSIHLMLLFIKKEDAICIGCEICFNTSHVVIYLMKKEFITAELFSFNTSHVVIYH